MPGKPYPTDVLDQALSVLDAWKQINEDMTFGDLTVAMLENDLNASRPIEEDLVNLETRMTDVRNQRDTLYAGIWEKLKRVRAGVKANYGDDSSQYEMVGGTRKSERKPATRKTPPSGS